MHLAGHMIIQALQPQQSSFLCCTYISMSPKKYTFKSFQSIQRELPEENPVHGEYHQRAEQESPRREEDPITESFYRKIRQAKADDSGYAENGCIDAPQLHRMKSGFTSQVFRRKETRYPGTDLKGWNRSRGHLAPTGERVQSRLRAQWPPGCW